MLGLTACTESLMPSAGRPGSNGPANPNGGPPSDNLQGDDPYEAPPTDASFSLEAGQTIQLSGTVTYAGSEKGDLVIQVLRVETGFPPKLLHSETLAQAGPFSISTPKALGGVSVVAFMDVDDNGMPSENDIGARADIQVQDAAIQGISLSLGDIELLGDLVPGLTLPGPPAVAAPEATEEPPPEPAPPEEAE
jgi:hypothetical protein